MSGWVNEDFEAAFSVRLRDFEGGQPATITAILDTGFTDELLLPSETIRRLRLVSSGVTLGDGSIVFMNVYELEIEWNDAWRRVKAYEGEDDALVGVSLLKGFEV